MKAYDFNETADFPRIDRSTALELAHVGTLPGAKVRLRHGSFTAQAIANRRARTKLLRELTRTIRALRGL